MNYLATFLEGIATFVSPCLLPLLPVYVAYFAGQGLQGVGDETQGNTARTVAAACAFVLGFGVVFTLLGAFAGTLGSLVVTHRRLLDVMAGALVALMGLKLLGVVHLDLLERTWGPQARPALQGIPGAFVFGLVFAVGWSPCVGPFLASALGLAAVAGSKVEGVALLACYSLGLGIPFVLSALLLEELEGGLAWVRAHRAAVERASGALLVVVGVLMACGWLGRWLALLA